MTPRLHRSAAVFALFCLFLPFAAAASEAVDDPAFRRANARTRALLVAFRDASRVPGLSVAIAVDGRLVFAAGFGIADLEHDVPATPGTRFRLGSTSKLLAAAATARLAQKGVLDLDADVRRYVPSFPDKGAPITARQLAGHLAGIRHYSADDYIGDIVDFRHFDTAESALSIFRDDPLRHPPGERYAYTTYGYTLLTAALEGAAGRPYLEILRDEVLDPIGMSATAADAPRAIVRNRSGYYEMAEGERVHAQYVDPSYKWAGGGMLSTAPDLVRFGIAHASPGFLEPEMLETAMTPQTTTAGESTRVGLGWRVHRDFADRRMVHHEGSMGGCRSTLVVFPDEKVVIALLSNLTGTPAFVFETAQVIAAPFLAGRRPGREAQAAPAGEYAVDAESNGRALQGTLTLRKGEPGRRGRLTVGPLDMSIADVVRHGDGWALVLVHGSAGLLPAPVTVRGDTIEADLRFGDQALRFTARRRGR